MKSLKLLKGTTLNGSLKSYAYAVLNLEKTNYSLSFLDMTADSSSNYVRYRPLKFHVGEKM